MIILKAAVKLIPTEPAFVLIRYTCTHSGVVTPDLLPHANALPFCAKVKSCRSAAYSCTLALYGCVMLKMPLSCSSKLKVLIPSRQVICCILKRVS